MKKIRYYTLPFFFCAIFLSCYSLVKSSFFIPSYLKSSATINVNNHEPRECIASVELFDTLTNWQNRKFDPSRELEGYIQYSAQVSHGVGEYGLLTYLNKKDSSFIMIFAKTAGEMVCEVKGIKKILVQDKRVLFETLCRTQCDFDQPATSMIKIDKDGNVRTIKSWVVDKSVGKVFKLKNSKVDCVEAYYTDYD